MGIHCIFCKISKIYIAEDNIVSLLLPNKTILADRLYKFNENFFYLIYILFYILFYYFKLYLLIYLFYKSFFFLSFSFKNSYLFLKYYYYYI